MLTIDGIEGLRARLGQELGVSDWVEVSQADIDAFAKATRDFYWIHVIKPGAELSSGRRSLTAC